MVYLYGKEREIVEWDEDICLEEYKGEEVFESPCQLAFQYLDHVEEDGTATLPRYLFVVKAVPIHEAIDLYELAELTIDCLNDMVGYEFEFEPGELRPFLRKWLQKFEHTKYIYKRDYSKVVDLAQFWENAVADLEEYNIKFKLVDEI